MCTDSKSRGSIGGVVAGVRLFAAPWKPCFPLRVANECEEGDGFQIEACVLARYLVGRTPPQELIDRYEKARHTLFTEPVEPRDAALVGFVQRHPWSVPFLDAASGIFRPEGLLRRKILTMGAILETAPEFADEFLPRSAHPVALVLRLCGLGFLALSYSVLGSLLYAAAIRSRT